jgi:hypothetical protein
MIYHLWKVPATNMSPMQQLDHAITVRNRHLGPDVATSVSPYLDVEISEDNKRLLQVHPVDLNMFQVLRNCNVKHGERRRVAKRVLTMLGTASGQCGFLNGAEQMKDIKACLEFGNSLEQVKYAEKMRKQKAAKAKQKSKEEAKAKRKARQEVAMAKMKDVYQSVLAKLSASKVCRSNVEQLTGPQCKAVAMCQCGGARLTGRVTDVRTALTELLPDEPEEPDVPSYPTQDELFEPVSDADDASVSIELTCDFETMSLGDCVEAYWEGEETWYEGEVTAIDVVDKTFEILYHSDNKKVWHRSADYPCRFAA